MESYYDLPTFTNYYNSLLKSNFAITDFLKKKSIDCFLKIVLIFYYCEKLFRNREVIFRNRRRLIISYLVGRKNKHGTSQILSEDF